MKIKYFIYLFLISGCTPKTDLNQFIQDKNVDVIGSINYIIGIYRSNYHSKEDCFNYEKHLFGDSLFISQNYYNTDIAYEVDFCITNEDLDFVDCCRGFHKDYQTIDMKKNMVLLSH